MYISNEVRALLAEAGVDASTVNTSSTEGRMLMFVAEEYTRHTTNLRRAAAELEQRMHVSATTSNASTRWTVAAMSASRQHDEAVTSRDALNGVFGLAVQNYKEASAATTVG